MKKVLIFAPEIHTPFIEGIQKSAWYIIKEMIQNETEVHLITQISYGEKLSRFSSHLKVYYLLNKKKNRLLTALYWFFAVFEIIRIVNKNQLKKVIIFSIDFSFLLPILILRFMKKEFIVLIYSLGEIENKIKISVLKLIKNQVNKIIVQSDFMKDAIKKRINGIAELKIFKALFLPDKEKFISEKFSQRSLNIYGYLSNASEEAGVYDILQLAKECPHLTFYLAIRKFSFSEEKYFQKLLLFIKKEKIKNIKIFRNIENMKEFLNSITGLINPVRNEKYTMAIPLSILECFLTKTLVFLRELPVFKELKDYVVTFQDINELKGVLKKDYFKNEFITEKLKAAFEYAKENIISPQKMLKLLLE